MSLQRRLIYLLTAFASFALAASFGTVYGIQLHVENAIANFQRALDDSHWLEHLRLDVADQANALRAVVEGSRTLDEAYVGEQREFLVKLRQTVTFASDRDEIEELDGLCAGIENAFARCLTFVSESDRDGARSVLASRIENDLLPRLESRLQVMAGRLDDSRRRAVDSMAARNTQVLALSLLVGVFGAALVAVGTLLVRRWVIQPIRALEGATGQFGRGNLDYRVKVDTRDELGALGTAMNGMAGSLAVAQADVRASEAKHRSLFENLRDATLICDAEGQVLECHDGDTNLLGMADCHGERRHLLEIWPGMGKADVDWPALIRDVLTEGRQVRAPDVQIVREGDGATADVELIAYPVEFGHGRHVAIVLRDVTERRRLERQARHAEAIEATVTFARGVAHDFNNLLTSAIGSLSLVTGDRLASGVGDRVQRALRACWQAARLSRRLLEFSSTDRGHPQVLCLRETVELILASLDEAFLVGVRLVTQMSDPVPVRMDRDQLTQIVLNLLHNAREAMPDRGELRVEVGTVRLRDAVEVSGPATHGRLTVADTGCGMSPEVRERLFEPFFTTKSSATSRARGMGMAIVYGAVRGAGGLIKVDAQPGGGTVFRVYLPLGDAVSGVEALPAPDVVSAASGSGRILVVDDEPMVLQFCADALTAWGYSVVTAGSAADAERVFEKSPDEPIGLAILDTDLPDRGGVELAQALVFRAPGLRVVLSSGLAEVAVPREIEGNVSGQLAKPYRLDALYATVSASLAVAKV